MFVVDPIQTYLGAGIDMYRAKEVRPIFSKDKVLRVGEVRDGLPGEDVWLYARQLEDGSLKYSLTNAPESSTLEDIRKPALMRQTIEQCFKELKEYLGMDHYEARNWVAFH